MTKIYGIHHVSSISKHPQQNIDFYASVFGLRLVKKTLNFDNMYDFHFYFGNHDASHNVATFFPIADSDEGEVGRGQVGYVVYAIPEGSMMFWEKRLKSFKIPVYKIKRFNETRLGFQDTHGLEIELVEAQNLPLNHWEFNGVDSSHAIRGITNAGLYSSNPEETMKLLTEIFGYEITGRDEEMFQLKVNDAMGGTLELRKKVGKIGKRGHGTVHHIALKVHADELESWRTKLIDAGFQPTEIRNRKYFQSIYFRDRGGILFELATEGPGMLLDESLENLGTELMIPPHFEKYREQLLENAMPLFVQALDTIPTYGYRNRKEYEMQVKRKKILSSIHELKAIENRDDKQEATLKELRKAFIEVSKETL